MKISRHEILQDGKVTFEVRATFPEAPAGSEDMLTHSSASLQLFKKLEDFAHANPGQAPK